MSGGEAGAMSVLHPHQSGQAKCRGFDGVEGVDGVEAGL